MLNKLKSLWTSITSVLSKASGHTVAILVGIVGVLLYFINLKHKEVNAMKAQIDLVTTQRQADVLESQIKEKLQDNTLLQKEVDGYTQSLLQLQDKRKTLAAAPDTRTDQQVQDYWKNN